jgi:transposase InsO family protein
MTQQQINRKLNNMIWSDTNINNFENMIRNNELPLKYKGFQLINGKIIYAPTGQQVIPDNKVNDTIQDIYDEYGLSSGIKKLYEQMSRRYINIKRKDVKAFLDRQIEYQLTKKPIRKTNKKMITKDINKIWSIDLIDMNPFIKKNKGYKYILTCVDNFSRYVMLERLKNKNSKDVAKAIKDIITKVGNKPRAILSDNGNEFNNEILNKYCEDNEIKQIYGLTYNPRSNALAEATNKIVRDTLQRIFVINGNFNWCDYLDEVMKSINDTQLYPTKTTRNEVYLDNKNKGKIRETMTQKQKQNIETLNVGDMVRVSTSSLHSDLRKREKQGEQKNTIVKFSLEPYTIIKIFKSKNKLLKNTYEVEDEDGEKLPRRFFENELLYIPDNTTENDNLNANKVNELNNLQSSYVIPRNENTNTRGTRANITRSQTNRRRSTT